MAEILDGLMQHKEKIKILESLTEYIRLHTPYTLYGVEHLSKTEEAKIVRLLKQLIDKRLVSKIVEEGRTFYYITFEGEEILKNIKRVINILK